MRVIFLDIDGVLNSWGTKERLDGYIFIEPSKVELLKQLVDRTGAKIVLSSTWRHGWSDLDDGVETIDARLFIGLRDKLKEYGLEFSGYTPIIDFGQRWRGAEIKKWICEWQGELIESFVILDDLDVDYLHPFEDKVVGTSMMEGFLQEHVDLAVKILDKQDN